MAVLSETRDRLMALCRDAEIDLAMSVTVKGVEGPEGLAPGGDRLIEATVDGSHGEAWVDPASAACGWQGTLGDVFSMPLKAASKRAVVVATMNALASRLGLTGHNFRCRHGTPLTCGRELVRQLKGRFEDLAHVLVVGCQPGVVEALVEDLGAKGVRVLEHSASHVGKVLHGVRVENGNADITADVRWCDVMLVTGASVVNGTLDDLLRHSHNHSKPLVFYGNTIAAVAAVADLERICPAGAH